ncbi:MAG: DNRLRE domain-containing protein [Bryobacteraceae bacterium]
MNIRTVSPLLLAMAAASAAYGLDLPVVADVHVGASTPQSGALPNLLVGGGNRALLRFDLSVLPAGLGPSQVVKATLMFHANRIASAGSVRVAPLAGPFQEMTVTQATAPPVMTGPSVGVVHGLNLVDITPIVQFWVAMPASAYGLELADAGAPPASSTGSPGLSVQIDSRENTATSFPAEIRLVLSGPAGPQGLMGPTGATGPTGGMSPSMQTGLCEGLIAANRPLPAGMDCPSKLVFLTNSTTRGAFGGLAGADATCNSEAAAAGRAGTFKAWLSDGTQSAASRMIPSTLPYRRSDGALLAYHWGDLVDGSLHAPINRTAAGVAIVSPSLVWTNTAGNGTIAGNEHCSNWGAPVGSFLGLAGSALATDEKWTASTISACNIDARLYCIQQ